MKPKPQRDELEAPETESYRTAPGNTLEGMAWFTYTKALESISRVADHEYWRFAVGEFPNAFTWDRNEMADPLPLLARLRDVFARHRGDGDE